jgi:hypothetical protein
MDNQHYLYSTAHFPGDENSYELDYFVAKFDPSDTRFPVAAYKNRVPLDNPKEIFFGTLLWLRRRAENQSEEQAMLAEILWDGCEERWESHQHDQIDKNLEPWQ